MERFISALNMQRDHRAFKKILVITERVASQDLAKQGQELLSLLHGHQVMDDSVSHLIHAEWKIVYHLPSDHTRNLW